MITTLSVALLLLCQEPIGVALRAVHTHRGVAASVDAILKESNRVGSGSIRGFDFDGLQKELRAAGLEAIEVGLERIGFTQGRDPVEEAFTFAARSYGIKKFSPQQVGKLDLQGFNRVMEHCFRALHKALGPGRDVRREAARFHSSVGQVSDFPIAEGLTRQQEQQLRDYLDRISVVDTAEILRLAARIVRAGMQLDRDGLQAKLRRETARPPRSIEGIEGEILVDRDTSYGRLVVGGFGRNRYDCSAVDVIVDLGGDDLYEGPAGGASEMRRMAVVIDLAGDDEYRAISDGLGSATLGLGVLLDMAGADRYYAERRSAGFGAGGVGVFMDLAGNDSYEIGDLSGGVGLTGIGLFMDLQGDDRQTAGVRSFGCGMPGGLGIFIDMAGKDVRTLGRVSLGVFGESAFASLGMGIGIGLLPSLPGGLGIFLDEAGDDHYQLEGFGLGMGIRGGTGLFRDRSGDDTYRGGNATMGSALLKGTGMFIDDRGEDDYLAGSLSLGAADASGIAWFLERRGDDRYQATAPSLGEARRASLATFIDLQGKEIYRKDSVKLLPTLGLFRDQGTAIGLFLDEGGALDEFRFNRVSAPSNGKQRMLESGSKPLLEILLLVDR